MFGEAQCHRFCSSVDGGIVGPTFGCLLGNMFNRLKYGDRFFYEHGGQAGSFKPGKGGMLRFFLSSCCA